MADELIAKLRYMGRQYANGQTARGGGERKHYLEEAADRIEAAESALAKSASREAALVEELKVAAGTLKEVQSQCEDADFVYKEAKTALAKIKEPS